MRKPRSFSGECWRVSGSSSGVTNHLVQLSIRSVNMLAAMLRLNAFRRLQSPRISPWSKTTF